MGKTEEVKQKAPSLQRAARATLCLVGSEMLSRAQQGTRSSAASLAPRAEVEPGTLLLPVSSPQERAESPKVTSQPCTLPLSLAPGSSLPHNHTPVTPPCPRAPILLPAHPGWGQPGPVRLLPVLIPASQLSQLQALRLGTASSQLHLRCGRRAEVNQLQCLSFSVLVLCGTSCKSSGKS